MPHWIKPNCFDIDVASCKMLTLKSVQTIRRFTEQYSANVFSTLKLDHLASFGIDWPRVAAVYDGIEIPRYIYQCRLERGVIWYYGWDCASGCVWNLDRVRIKQEVL